MKGHHTLFAAWLWAATALGATGAEPQARKDLSVESIEDLWRGYDPGTLPLEIEVLRTWEEDGIAFQKLRFTGEIVDGVKVRVFAIQGAPRTGKALPGVLHVHGGGQTASLDWVRFWAKRGYVGVTFDFCGKLDKRTEYTDWGPLKQGNMAEAAGGFQLRPTPRASSWFHWTLVSRRALTLLARHPQIDPERLGVFGISVGGTLTWMIAGVDARVKAAAPIYGCGYNYDRRNARWNILVPNDDYNLFQRFLAPEAYAPYVRCPLLFFDATNDGHGIMDRAFEALGATSGPTWQVFSPRTDHHIEPREGRDLALWMDWHLKGGPAWPKSPVLKVSVDAAGVPRGTVTPAANGEVAAVDVYYNLGDKRPQVRFWREATAKQQGQEWQAALPVLDAWDDLRAFANVTYHNGVCLSTALTHAIPAQLGKARATLSQTGTIEHGSDGVAHWKFLGAYTDPSVDWTHLRPGRDEHFGPFIGFNLEHLGDPVVVQLYTHILGDPQFQGKSGASLAFDVRGGFTDDGLVVRVLEEDRSLRAKTYTVKLTKSQLTPGWRTIELPLANFKDAEGRSPTSWPVIDKLEIVGRAARSVPPQFAKLRWLEPHADRKK